MDFDARQIRKVGNGGFAIIENIAAIAILAVIAIGGLALTAYFSRRTDLASSQCKLYASQVIERVRSQGLAPVIYSWEPNSTNGSSTTGGTANRDAGTAAAYISKNNNALIDNQAPGSPRWPSTLDILGANPQTNTVSGPNLGSALLIDGAINTLVSIYNEGLASGKNYCSGTVGTLTYPTLAGAVADFTKGQLVMSLNGSLVTPTIQIIPYNVNTGQVYNSPCPSTPFYILPAGLYGNTDSTDKSGEPPPGTSGTFSANIESGPGNKLVTLPGNVHSDWGLILKVWLQYQTTNQGTNVGKDAITQSCMVQQSFQYQADVVAPAMPSVSVTTQNVPGASACLNGPWNTTTVQISPSGTGEAGTQYVCRDHSSNPLVGYVPQPGNTAYGDPSNPIYSCFSSVYGSPAAPLVPQPAHYTGVNSPGADYPLAENTIPTPVTGYSVPGPTANLGWVPCDQFQICNTYPTSATFSGPAALKLQYGLPPGCRVVFDVAAVDTAGNANLVTNQGQWGPSNMTLGTSYLTQGYIDVPVPPCIPPGAPWTTPYYCRINLGAGPTWNTPDTGNLTNGYFTCNLSGC